MLSALLVKWKHRLQDGGIANQFFMALMVTIPVLNFGMLMGWQSPMTPILQSKDGPAPEPISDETISWMASITFFPPIFCGFLVGDLADRWGRKITTLLTSLMLSISWIIIFFSLRPWALILSRTVAGVACAGCYVVTPLYLKEVASDRIRGALGSLFILSQNLGYLVVYVAGDMMSFYSVLWLCTAIPLVHMVLFLGVSETPVFLVKQGKVKEARKALAFLRNTSVDDKNLEEEVQQMEREEEYARTMKKATWKSIRVADSFRLNLTVAEGTPNPCPIRQTCAVPKPTFSAAAAVRVFTRDPGQGIRVIPRKTGSLLNFATLHIGLLICRVPTPATWTRQTGFTTVENRKDDSVPPVAGLMPPFDARSKGINNINNIIICKTQIKYI